MKVKAPVWAEVSRYLVEFEMKPSAAQVVWPFKYKKTLGCDERDFESLIAAQQTVLVRRERPIRAIFFDMDATVIKEETIVVLAEFAGLSERVSEITERAMKGELDFREALTERVALLKNLPVTILEQAFSRLTLNPGIAEIIGFFKERGIPSYLISGGFLELAGPLAERLGFAGCHANTLGKRLGVLTGEVVGAIVDAEAKRAFLLSTCKELGISPLDACAVGDGANDLPMMLESGDRIGFRPKPVLWPHLTGVNWVGDHRFLEVLA